MCANSEGSGETARMRRVARAFAGRLCGKYHNLMSWPKIIEVAVDGVIGVLLAFVFAYDIFYSRTDWMS